MPGNFPTFNRSPEHRYAIFLAYFGESLEDVLPRAVVNDFCIFRDILINRYGYRTDNIIYALGEPVDGEISYSSDGCVRTITTSYGGNCADFDQALSTLSALTNEDTLFLFVSGHGGADESGSYIGQESNKIYRPCNLATKLNSINCEQLIVLMNQCNCGGFIEALTTMSEGPQRIYAMAACSANEKTATCGPPNFCDKHFPFSAAISIALDLNIPDPLSGGCASCLPSYSAPPVPSFGTISAEEAFTFSTNLVESQTQTPQSKQKGGNDRFYWGLPDIELNHGNPSWESPDIFLLNPDSLGSSDTITEADIDLNNAITYWGDIFHGGVKNRIVARVSNKGSAPALGITVSFYLSPFGVNTTFTKVGSYVIDKIEVGQHAYAFIDYEFPTEQHLCVVVRAACAADEAQDGMDSCHFNPNDNNNAQRNMDIRFVPLSARGGAFSFNGLFNLRHAVRKRRTFSFKTDSLLDGGRFSFRFNRPDKGVMAVSGRRTVSLGASINIADTMEAGERVRIHVAWRGKGRNKHAVGGVTYAIELADGRLEGKLVSQSGVLQGGGEVTLWHARQFAGPLTAVADQDGNFLFDVILPGTYRFRATSQMTTTEGVIFVEPNRTTTTTITLR